MNQNQLTIYILVCENDDGYWIEDECFLDKEEAITALKQYKKAKKKGSWYIQYLQTLQIVQTVD